jgi:N-acetyl-anhydromuramyl-L-alanine amidase AmpD/uncharacterized protein YraI
MSSFGKVVGALVVTVGVATTTQAQAQAKPPTRFIAANSGNYTARSSRGIDQIVIHTIEGSEAGAISWFQSSRSRVSAHYIVAHSGRITQMMRDSDRAWHAGHSGTNSRSIGIENEGYAGRNNWTTAQYESLAALVRYLCNQYGIPKDRAHIFGHNEVPGAAGRKSDPGRYFDWNRFMRMVGSSPSTGSSGSAGSSSGSTTPVSTSGGTYAVEVTASALNVRNGVYGSILGQISRGQRFVVHGQRQGWLAIDYAGRDGWISGSYVRRVSGVSLVRTTANVLNVRSGPGTGYRRVGSTTRGQTFVRTGRSGSWIRIQYDGSQRWVHGDYTQGLVAQAPRPRQDPGQPALAANDLRPRHLLPALWQAGARLREEDQLPSVA